MVEDAVAGHGIWHGTMGHGARRAVLIHCSLATAAAWAPLMARLGDRITATVFDLPGHGRSADWRGGDDYQAETVAIAAALAAPGPVDLVGHSFGATAALRLAVESPDLVRSLTLIEPVYFAATQGTPAYARHQAAMAPFEAALAAGDRDEAARIFTSIWGSGRPWDRLAPADRKALSDRIHLIPAAAPDLEGDRAGVLATGRIEALCCPVLLIDGAQSPPVIADIHRHLAGRLPGAQCVTVAGAGHMVPITHPDEVAAALAALLDAAA